MIKKESMPRVLFFIWMFVVIGFGIMYSSISAKAASSPNPVADGWYMIVSGNSDDRVLDIKNWSQSNGGNLETYKKNNTTNQRFFLQYRKNGYYSIRVLHSGKYLHKANAGWKDDVHQWDGYGAKNTQWAISSAGNGYYYIRSRSGNYLDNSNGSTALGNNVVTHSFNGSKAQKWKFLSTSTVASEKRSIPDGWYMIESGNSSNRVLDINNWSMDNGGNLEIYKKNGTTNQIFYLEYRNNGYYSIKVNHSGKYLHKQNSGYSDNVHQWDGYGADNTQWSLEYAGNGYYYIRSKSGNYLDNQNGSTALGNNVITHNFNGSWAQKWKFISAAAPIATETYYVTTQAGLYLRESPTQNSAKKELMSYGSSLQVESITGEWAKVQYNGIGGYCAVRYISKTKPSTDGGNTNVSSGVTSPVPAGCKFSKKTYDGGWLGYHDINKNVSSNTPVYAIADGTVTYKQAYRTYSGTRYLTSYGNFIEFKAAGNGYTAKYCHLSRFAGANQIISSSNTKRVSGSNGVLTVASRSVKKGEIIGYIGTTGNSSGLHLHFELRKNGSRVDPTSVFGGLV